MSEIQWIVCTFLLFIALFTIMRWWQKDNKGALMLALAVVIVAALLISVSGCAVSPEYRPWMEAGIAYDTQETVGNNPACVVRVRQPVIPERLIVSYTHHSSCPDLRDRNTVDQLEFISIIPLGRKR